VANRKFVCLTARFGLMRHPIESEVTALVQTLGFAATRARFPCESHSLPDSRRRAHRRAELLQRDTSVPDYLRHFREVRPQGFGKLLGRIAVALKSEFRQSRLNVRGVQRLHRLLA
jgi:hypothetical protein